MIETERLLLRHLTSDDVGKVFRMSREEGIRRWIPDQVYRDEEESATVIKSLIGQYSGKARPDKKPLVLGLELKQTGELIGHVGLSPALEGVEIGYAVETRLQGQGYATEAVTAMSLWAIRSLKIVEVLGIVDRENAASCRVLEKSGYVICGEKHKEMFGCLRWCRIYRYAGPDTGC